MRLYDVPGYDTPKMLTPEHADELGATEHAETAPPKRNGPLAEWAAYAVAQGADAAWVEAATRQDLIDHYGG